MSDQPPPSWLAPPPPSAPPPPPPPPPPVVPPPAPEAPGAAQLWGAPASAPRRDFGKLIPVVGAIVLILVAGLVLRDFLFPGFRTQPVYPTPTPTPAAVEYTRASAFWDKAELPAIAAVTRSMPAIKKYCKGKLAAACRTSIEATDQKLQFAITVINTGDVPACLTTHVTRLKSDLLSMDGGLQIALRGYKAGDIQQVNQGLAQYSESSSPLSQDAKAVTNDVIKLCN